MFLPSTTSTLSGKVSLSAVSLRQSPITDSQQSKAAQTESYKDSMRDAASAAPGGGRLTAALAASSRGKVAPQKQ